MHEELLINHCNSAYPENDDPENIYFIKYETDEMENIKIPIKQSIFNILIAILKNLFQLKSQQVQLFFTLLITYLVNKCCNDLKRMNFNLFLLRLSATKK